MINSFTIKEKADYLRKHYAVCDPFDLVRELDIALCYGDYGQLLGMYTYRWRRRAILLNNRLTDPLRRMVLAHEIGHDLFHRELAKDGLKEFTLFDMKSITEYEANAFAAHFLLDDKQVLELAKSGYDVAQIASVCNVNINLLLIKMQEMNRMGAKYNVPWVADGEFLKAMKT